MPTSLNQWRLPQTEPIRPWLAHGFNELDEVDRISGVAGATQAIARDESRFSLKRGKHDYGMNQVHASVR